MIKIETLDAVKIAEIEKLITAAIFEINRKPQLMESIIKAEVALSNLEIELDSYIQRLKVIVDNENPQASEATLKRLERNRVIIENKLWRWAKSVNKLLNNLIYKDCKN